VEKGALFLSACIRPLQLLSQTERYLMGGARIEEKERKRKRTRDAIALTAVENNVVA